MIGINLAYNHHHHPTEEKKGKEKSPSACCIIVLQIRKCGQQEQLLKKTVIHKNQLGRTKLYVCLAGNICLLTQKKPSTQG